VAVMEDFVPFPKMARLSREIVVTEKLDGTNAQIVIGEDGSIRAGSRTRWITPKDDHFGFAAWVAENTGDLLRLGPGRHYGEWWGRGIQRGYGITDRRLSLFNASRWGVEECPPCCHVVPVLYRGDFDTSRILEALGSLAAQGSVAAPGFLNPEGIVVYHTASGVGFKKTIHKDEKPKSEA
jgi:hypothetical protein